MSSQPSQLAIAKDKASNAYELTKDVNGQTIKKDDFRDRLNEASKGPLPQKEEGFVENSVGALQQATFDQEPEIKKVKDDGTPPMRPDNDVQVEEFLRGQYKTSGKKEQSIEGRDKK